MILSNNIDANQRSFNNLVIQNLASAPGSPVAGQYWYNTGDGYIYYRNGSTTVQLSTLTQLLATRLDQFAAPTASVSLNSQKITNLQDGSAVTDAATYGQLVAMIQGMRWKDAVRTASTTNITLSGLQTQDGVSLIAGDRHAAMGQTTGSANGIYVVGSGAWTRATDADTAAEVFGMTFFVSEGTANGNKVYNMTTDNPITLNTTALVFAQIGGGGTSYSAGTGINITGSVIAVAATTPQKFTATIGNGSLTEIPVTHSLSTKNIVVSLRKVSTDEIWLHDVTATSTSIATFKFSTAPTTNEFEVTIIG